MKCPKCQYYQKVKFGMYCGGCGYKFAFNPKESDTRGLTDGKFAACIRSASQNDTAYFTRNQLYAAFCRRMCGSPAIQFGCAAIALIACTIFALLPIIPFAFITGLVGLLLLINAVSTACRTYPRRKFDGLLQRWLRGRPIDKLIEETSLHKPPPNWSEPDIYNYGVERILLVERDILVDLLVKNGLHAEHRMLVVSESGYPDYLAPVAQRLLQEKSDLPVFLLHDATAFGVGMEHRVRESELFPISGHPVTDLGMFPADFKNMKGTKHYDPTNKDRALPVDALLIPFMTLGLGAAMTEGLAIGAMMEQQVSTSGSYDFG